MSLPMDPHPATPNTARALWLGVLPALALTVFVWSSFFATNTLDNSYNDWRFRSDYAGYAVHTVFDEHVMPYWTTSSAFEQLRAKGNHGFFSNPETEVFSPYIVLYRVFPFVTAVKVALGLHVLVGLWGAALLSVRGFGLRQPSAIWLVSLLLFSSGFFTQHFLVGHAQFASYTYFPLVFYLFLRASGADVLSAEGGALSLRGRVLRAALGAALLALCVYEGNVHLLIHFWMFLGGYVVLSPLAGARTWRATCLAFALLLVFFVLLSAYKMLPMLFEYGAYRSDYLLRYENLSELVTALLDREFWLVPGYNHERTLYVGRVGLGLMLFAYLVPRRASLPFIGLSVVFLVLCFCPYPDRLRELPLMRTQGAFTRLRGMFVLANVCLLALSLTRVFGWLAHRTSRWPTYGLHGVLVASSLYLAYDLRRPFAEHVHIFSRFQIDLPAVRSEAPMLVANWEAEPIGSAPSMLPGRSGAVHIDRARANAFTYTYQGDASAARPVVLWGPGLDFAKMGQKLHVIGDVEPLEHRGRFAVRVRTPRARFALRYAPWYLIFGGAVSLLTVLGLLAYACFGRTRARGVVG